ncbi:hypothetical protein AC249_AIPGENE24094 [Exaiptasia diaphana]|nr:hypothetical protein AC249_AIPGENE24094 [Exaiptasia diaphana]
MENEDDLSMLTALLDDDSNDILTDAVEEVEKSNSESPKSTGHSSPNEATSINKNPKEKPRKETPKLVITKNPRQKRKADDISKEESSKGKDNSIL